MSLWKNGKEFIYSLISGVDGTVANVESREGSKSLTVIPGLNENFTVHLDVQNISATQAFMIVDLSDTANWPHTNIGHINFNMIDINVEPTTSFRGDVSIGFLSNVDATNGDFNSLWTFHFELQPVEVLKTINLSFVHTEGQLVTWFGPTDTDNVLFQTNVSLQGPDAATSYPSGDGDIILLVDMSAGNADIGITMGYNTIA